MRMSSVCHSTCKFFFSHSTCKFIFLPSMRMSNVLSRKSQTRHFRFKKLILTSFSWEIIYRLPSANESPHSVVSVTLDRFWKIDMMEYVLFAELPLEPKEGVVREVLTNYVAFHLNCRQLSDSQHYQERRF